MAANGKPPVMVILQLTGGNDFMNTLVPYNNPVYYDARPTVVIPQDTVLPINDTLAFNPNAAPLKEMFDDGKVAIVQGIGYQNSSRSHFRGMDIWHTCEPDKIGTEGWVGRAIRDLDPKKENVLTGVNFGRGLPRAMALAGTPITSVGDLDNVGLMTGIEEEARRNLALDLFKKMYSPAVGTGPVMEYLAQTGSDVLTGADILKKAPESYTSEVEYADNPIAKSLKDVARVHLAGLGTRIFYTAHAGYDHHANELKTHPGLLRDLSGAIMDFFQDLRDHDAADEVSMLVFTEFGRRMRDNGSGTDHGSGGGAFIIGENVKGGLYAEYPSLNPSDWLKGEDLDWKIDFRGIYGTMLDQWMGLDSVPIVDGQFEQIHPFN
ncbi:MAG TPA: DUF1501 domain-containing protein [Dehalococcoidia bacterium]|jgi:uncharacterized protein (DUF1501 family)|nr:hypothetical protein [Dehalococcoidia bacterium]HHZ62338.1 DUF1501 domain-containing protein [Dehalococcoidia bacterium]HIA16460.1 DUF1501 domain-containing protein [Dehalococcoidia bacterium]HIM92093.1 DUF1501 domain-containing protein [Dehalococcoidia bacterium]HIN71924.1 DUF1501 domain-containing protein [Dehalococcoidia bacterium]|tara:strand:- start:4648 stop:5781 length:1134 start_codon:yes stop_codon:yes gene_type:complete